MAEHIEDFDASSTESDIVISVTTTPDAQPGAAETAARIICGIMNGGDPGAQVVTAKGVVRDGAETTHRFIGKKS